MNLYTVDKEYLTYLYEKHPNVFFIEHNIGTIIRLSNYIYFIPLDSPSTSDYDEHKNLKKTTPAIMRMIDSKTQRYLGKCLFSNMFAVPYKEVKKVQLEQYDDYIKNVMQKKIEYLFRNRDRVEKAAQRIYKQKIEDINKNI